MVVKLDTVFPAVERVFFSVLPLCYNEGTFLSNTVLFWKERYFWEDLILRNKGR